MADAGSGVPGAHYGFVEATAACVTEGLGGQSPPSVNPPRPCPC